MSLAPPSLPPLDDTFGALFLGCVLACIFYGMSLVQGLYYYTRTPVNDDSWAANNSQTCLGYPKDAWYLRTLVRSCDHQIHIWPHCNADTPQVAVMLALDTLPVCLIIHSRKFAFNPLRGIAQINAWHSCLPNQRPKLDLPGFFAIPGDRKQPAKSRQFQAFALRILEVCSSTRQRV